MSLAQVQLEHAPPNEKLYTNPLLGMQATGNSNAMRGAWKPLREAGAVARAMLVAAAAKRWGVEPESCRAQDGVVSHPPSGRHLKYGELAAEAAMLPVPADVPLKKPADWKLIGTPAKRLDAPGKVNGTALYGIDARPPGVKIATLAQSPVFGGRVKSLDDAAAKAVNGVRQIVRLDDAVAVVADHMGAAKKGLAALKIEWDDGPHAKLDTAADRGRARDRRRSAPGAVAQKIGDADTAHGERRDEGRGDLSGSVPGPRRDGADELHRARARGFVRALDRQPGAGAGSGDGREGRGPAAREGDRPQPSDRRRLRAAAGGRRRAPRRRDREARRRAGEGRLDARGGRPARHVSALLVSTASPRASTNRASPSPGTTASPAPRCLRDGLPPAFKDGLDFDSIEGAIDLVYDLPNFHVEYRARGASRHSDRRSGAASVHRTTCS